MSKVKMVKCMICGREFNKYTRKRFFRATCSEECLNELVSRNREKLRSKTAAQVKNPAGGINGTSSSGGVRGRSKVLIVMGCGGFLLIVVGLILVAMGASGGSGTSGVLTIGITLTILGAIPFAIAISYLFGDNTFCQCCQCCGSC